MCAQVYDLDGSFSTVLTNLTTVLAGISSSHVPFLVHVTGGVPQYLVEYTVRRGSIISCRKKNPVSLMMSC